MDDRITLYLLILAFMICAAWLLFWIIEEAVKLGVKRALKDYFKNEEV